MSWQPPHAQQIVIAIPKGFPDAPMFIQQRILIKPQLQWIIREMLDGDTALFASFAGITEDLLMRVMTSTMTELVALIGSCNDCGFDLMEAMYNGAINIFETWYNQRKGLRQ